MFLLAGVGSVTVALITAFMPTYVPFVCMRFLQGFLATAKTSAGFITGNTFSNQRKLNSKSSEYCLCGAIVRGLIRLLIRKLYHFIGVSIPVHLPLLCPIFMIRPREERWGPAEICQHLSVPIVSHITQARLD